MTVSREYLSIGVWFLFVATIWLGPTFVGYAVHAVDVDVALYYYPILDFYARALQSGSSFLWMPGIFSGFPIYVSQTGGFFDPVNIALYSVFDGISGTHVRLFLDLVVTFIFSYLAARSFGVSRTAAALVGPSYMLAFHMRSFSNPIISNSLFLLPLLFYAINSFYDNRIKPLWVVVLIGLGLGSAILSGYTQIVLYALLTAGLYVTLRAFLLEKESIVVQLKRKGITLSIGVVLGVIIGLPFLLPAVQFLPSSARATPPTYDQATLKVVAPGDLVLFALPDHVYVPYVTAGRKPLYIGAAWFVFSLMALAYACRRYRISTLSKEEFSVLSLSILASVLFVISFKWSPLFYVMSKVPILEQFRFPFRAMFLGSLVVSLLGAIGFDRVSEFMRERRVRIAVYGWAACAAVLGIGILAINLMTESIGRAFAGFIHILAQELHMYELIGMTKDAEHYASALQGAVKAAHEFLSLGDGVILTAFLVLIATITSFVAYATGFVSTELFKRIALSVTIATVITIPITRYRFFAPLAEVGTAQHAAISFVTEDDRALYRMYSFIPSAAASAAIPPQYKLSREEERAIMELTVTGGTPNYHLYHGLGSIDGYDQFESLDTLAAVGLVGGELIAGYGSGSHEERRQRLLQHLDVLAMMGGKYIISGMVLENELLTLISTANYTAYNLPLYVYQLDARPRFYIAEHVASRPHEGFRDLVTHGVPSFAEATYLNCDECARTSGTGKVESVAHGNGLYRLRVVVETEQYVVLSESFIPGWHVTLDGATIDPVRANGLYMAALVPPGEHELTFEYQGLRNELRVLKALQLVR